jgi:hypothetical protein
MMTSCEVSNESNELLICRKVRDEKSAFVGGWETRGAGKSGIGFELQL